MTLARADRIAFVFAFSACLTSVTAPVSQAATLGTTTEAIAVATSAGYPTAVWLYFPAEAASPALLYTVAMDNVGNTRWVASDSDDPFFSLAVTTLTNDRDDKFYFMGGNEELRGGGLLRTEQTMFGCPGFAGCTVNRIGLRVNSASYTYDGYWYRLDANVTFMVEGAAIPEPSSILALGFALMAFAGSRAFCPKRPA